MPLTQSEADFLLALPKEFLERTLIEFSPSTPMKYERSLRSTDQREVFILNYDRSKRDQFKVHYQTRGRVVIVLARLCLKARPHKNPPNAPYKPGIRIDRTHLHIYREGFDVAVAYELHDLPSWPSGGDGSDFAMFDKFLAFCAILNRPEFQTTFQP
ncbi:MAG: hypothetical protein HYT87_06535 [Nitrospirae bacterium]|nr:hypothetical protein [Nitrospirota bacterium]